MRKPLLAVLMAVLLVGACSHGHRNVPAKIPADPVTGVPLSQADPRPLVSQVTNLVVERVADGVIVHATGLPPTQGWWNAALVLDGDGTPVKGVLTLRFVLLPPTTPTPSSTPQSREITVAARLTEFQLAGVRQITVQGADNARSARR